ETGRYVYGTDSRGRDTAALVVIDSNDGQTQVLAEDPRADATGDVFVHPKQKHVQAAAFNYERREWKVIDPDVKADFEYLKTVVDGDFDVTSRTLDDKTWTVAYVVSDGPVRYYVYDRPAKKATFLFTNRPALEQLKLAKMRAVTIKSRDGLDLVSYLTLPVGTLAGIPHPKHGDRKKLGDAPRAKPLPMVLLVHGGPWSRDVWGLNSSHQWLANRGYAVLSVNYRGSTGFGKKFVNASNREWGGKMHDDLIDAVNWAVKQGYADKDKVAIMGGSYGGYATLVGVTMTPDVFACGVNIVGLSNLLTFLKTIPPYWESGRAMWYARMGDETTEEGRKLLEERSPLTHVDKIKKPLLIGHGANDPRVKQSESDQIVKTMQEKGLPVTYVLYPDEGHGFGRPENRLSFNAVAEQFLARHLGGRAEPVGKDFEGSTIEVKAGAEHVKGLEESLVRK
ncbi:MAG TPA: S9 family peptidase, partial [Tepidisphaeraceae bacterium]|nr:S9 family peptidase [Tepidisphaeraceae bacterium]